MITDFLYVLTRHKLWNKIAYILHVWVRSIRGSWYVHQLIRAQLQHKVPQLILFQSDFSSLLISSLTFCSALTFTSEYVFYPDYPKSL